MDCFFLTFVLQTDLILFRTNVDLIMMYVKIVTAAAESLTLTDELINAGTDVSWTAAELRGFITCPRALANFNFNFKFKLEIKFKLAAKNYDFPGLHLIPEKRKQCLSVTPSPIIFLFY